jgi:hypothetical protein
MLLKIFLINTVKQRKGKKSTDYIVCSSMRGCYKRRLFDIVIAHHNIIVQRIGYVHYHAPDRICKVDIGKLLY